MPGHRAKHCGAPEGRGWAGGVTIGKEGLQFPTCTLPKGAFPTCLPSNHQAAGVGGGPSRISNRGNCCCQGRNSTQTPGLSRSPAVTSGTDLVFLPMKRVLGASLPGVSQGLLCSALSSQDPSPVTDFPGGGHPGGAGQVSLVRWHHPAGGRCPPHLPQEDAATAHRPHSLAGQ